MQEHWRPANHITWLCHTPQLLHSPESFPLADYLPADWPLRVARWGSNPDSRPESLVEPANPRLGYYFERLYECVLTELMGWTLLGKNLQVREAGGQTLGEMDFLVRNPHTNAVEHHEIAVKFYMGYTGQGPETRWYGPNSHDRLTLKVRRLLEHQSRLGELPETRALLAARGIDEPVTPKIFMPGYLFYPAGQAVCLPEFVPGDHLRGHWLYHHDTLSMDTRHWVPLNKPHWLGPWWQPDRPDSEITESALASVEAQHRPRLFAALELAPDTGRWQEVARTFVVPSGWPEQV